MKRIVNAYTGTVHKPAVESRSQRTTCGALRHVPPTHVREVDLADDPLTDASRCGRCFEDEGGY